MKTIATFLDSAFARLAEVEWSRFMRGTAVGNSKTSVRIGNARSVRVGTAALLNARVASVDFHDVQTKVGHDVQGALGYELFERYGPRRRSEQLSRATSRTV